MIQIKGVTKRFANETGISYRDFEFETGKSYMLLGASGCGKSTLLNLIAGILSPDSGQIVIDGNVMNEKSEKEKDSFRIKQIGYIFQDFKLINEMTVLDNINVLRLEGVDTSSAMTLLERMGIAKKKNSKVKNLSGGEKQRVAIVRALVKSPYIILADEPTGNLNFEVGEAVIKELVSAASGRTLIAVTHDDRLSKYFDVVLDMNEMTSKVEEISSDKDKEDEKNA